MRKVQPFTPEVSCLLTLFEGAKTVKQVGLATGHSRQAVHGALYRLGGRGLVTNRPTAGDGRKPAALWSLTAKGQREAGAIAQAAQRIVTALVGRRG